MIVYTLKCENSHQFEDWFTSSAAFDEQAAAGGIACPECHSHRIAKAPMAPAVSGGRKAAQDCGFAGADTHSGAPPCANACGGGCLSG